jgi:hypothetical protein
MTPPAAAAAPSVHRGRTVAPPRPSVAPRKPRRVSGPSRRPARPLSRPVEPERGVVLGVLGALNGLSRNRSLDRLIRGRGWIVLIAFALIGIVTLQLLVLKLNANIGRSLVREGQLQRDNAALSIESSELAGGERVESQAAHLGMELVPEGALRFLSVDPHADIARAAAALGKPVQASSSSSSTEASSSSGAEVAAASTQVSTASTETSSGSSTAAAASATSTGGPSGSGEAGSGSGETAPAQTTASPTGEASAADAGAAPSAVSAPPSTAAGATGATEAAAGGASSPTQSNPAG